MAQEMAALALATLTSTDLSGGVENRCRMLVSQAQGIEPLINLTRNGHEHAKQNAMSALRNLGIDPNGFEDAAEATAAFSVLSKFTSSKVGEAQAEANRESKLDALGGSFAAKLRRQSTRRKIDDAAAAAQGRGGATGSAAPSERKQPGGASERAAGTAPPSDRKLTKQLSAPLAAVGAGAVAGGGAGVKKLGSDLGALSLLDKDKGAGSGSRRGSRDTSPSSKRPASTASGDTTSRKASPRGDGTSRTTPRKASPPPEKPPPKRVSIAA